MHFLECIAMLLYLETKLKIGQRVQVEVGVVDELSTILLQISKKLENQQSVGTMTSSIISDIVMSTDTIRKTSGLIYLPDKMRDTLLEGIASLKSDLCVGAYHYFTLHELPEEVCNQIESGVEYSQSPKEVLREVASVAIAAGLYRQ